MNQPLTSREYHRLTKNVPGETSTARLVEAALVPLQYKRYLDRPAIGLPRPADSGVSLFETLTESAPAGAELSLAELASVLHYTTGITTRKQINGRVIEFRAASCTGALYHIEAYVVCRALDGLSAGLYHYDVPGGCLRQLRSGDYRSALGKATGGGVRLPEAWLLLTSTWWRNAWRYEERAYRHAFWDAGTVLANLLAVSRARRLVAKLCPAFVDGEANRLLGIDHEKEACIAIVALGSQSESEVPAPPFGELRLSAESLSRAEIEYPLIWQTHEASSLPDADAVRRWHDTLSQTARPATPPPPDGARESIESVIRRRASARRFGKGDIDAGALQTLLAAALTSIPSDAGRDLRLCDAFLLVHSVRGIEPGAYRLQEDRELALLRAPTSRAEATHLALDQPVAGQAAVNIYFTARWSEVDILGERGYRAVQTEAGIRSGRLYLAATALGLRATGLTFYDDDVARFFDLDPEDTAVLMLMAIGR